MKIASKSEMINNYINNHSDAPDTKLSSDMLYYVFELVLKNALEWYAFNTFDKPEEQMNYIITRRTEILLPQIIEATVSNPISHTEEIKEIIDSLYLAAFRTAKHLWGLTEQVAQEYVDWKELDEDAESYWVIRTADEQATLLTSKLFRNLRTIGEKI